MNISMRNLLEAGVHFGHQTRFWHPKMAPYIYGARNRIHIINLEHTLPALRQAAHFAKDLASTRGQILFVGTKRNLREVVRQEADRCEMPYVVQRWLGGTLTNFATVRRSIGRLLELEKMLQDGAEGLTKKERLTLDRHRQRLDRSLGGFRLMERLPDALFVVDVGHEHIAVSEANRLGIPVIGVVDTNSSPEGIQYVIPGNDDARLAVELYCQVMADAILEGREASDRHAVPGELLEEAMVREGS
jgi:small subunit ribosomal protein S2